MRIVHPVTGETAVSLEDAKAALEAAQSRYEKTKSDADEARRAETDALNGLNKAQKIFDCAVNDIRGLAPRDSDWKASQRRCEAVEVS